MSQTTERQMLRDSVLQLAREIEALSGSDLPPEAFFPTFLDRLKKAVAGRAAMVWLAVDGPLRLAYHVGLDDVGLTANPQAMGRNEPLLAEALSTGESKAYPPDEKTLPTGHLYFVAALSIGSRPVGVLQVLQRPETTPSARTGLLQFIEQMAGYASRYLSRRREGETDAQKLPERARPAEAVSGFAGAGASSPASGLPPAFWTALEKFLLQLQRSRTVAEVASTAASDGRLLLGVDRVSLVRKWGRKTPVEAISGQDKVNPRANLVRRMTALCKTVMAAREPFVYAGRVDDLPPQLEQPLAEYVAESNSRLVLIVPLFESNEIVRPELEEKDQERHAAVREPRVIGCIVAEQINDSRMPPALREKLDVASDHVAASLQQAITFERIFLRRTLLAIGRTGEWFHGRKLAKTLAVAAVIAVVGLSLWLIPYPYRVTAEGRLMPVVQRDVFAPWDGDVMQLAVRGGEVVAKGDQLAVLRNDELRVEIARLEAEIGHRQTQADDLVSQITEAGRRSADEQMKLRSERKALVSEIEGLGAQLDISRERRDRLKVTAPITGTIATFQLDQRLGNRPVRRGEVLMEVMDDKGDWHLEIDVEDVRMGHILRAIRREGGVGLPVEFVLATDPESTYKGTLKNVETVTQTDAELGNVVRVDVALADQNALPDRRIGAEVRAKIDTGPQPLGYVLFGDVYDFIRKYLWL